MTIKALQICKAFFVPAKILEASSIQVFSARDGPRKNAAISV